MAKLYKLTNQDGTTQGGTLWGEGVRHSIPKKKRWGMLCTAGVLHAYKDPNLALLLNPIHAGIRQPRLWEARGSVCCEDWGKCGCFTLTTVEEMAMPGWWEDVGVRVKVQAQFAVLCVESVLGVFEVIRPRDKGPRKAVQVAVEWLGGDSGAILRADRAAREAEDSAYYAAVEAAGGVDAKIVAQTAASAVARAGAWTAWAVTASAWTDWSSEVAVEAINRAAVRVARAAELAVVANETIPLGHFAAQAIGLHSPT